jgi:iron complex transport system substrate-binding protein
MMRICSLLPGATEIAYLLGLGDELVGVTHECDYPREAKTKPVIVKSAFDPQPMSSAQIDFQVGEQLRNGRSLYTIDIERFIGLAPDIVVTQDLCDVCAIDPNQVVAACRSLPNQPTIIALAPTCLSDVLADIARIGEATAATKRAEVIVKALRERIERVGERASQSTSRPRVACLEWLDPIYYAGHWVPEMVEIAGGHNGFGENGQPSAKCEWQAVLKFSPEIILLMPCGFETERTQSEYHLLQELDGWSELPAVKSGRVFAVNGHAYFSRPGPRLVDGLELLAQLIHPELSSSPVSPDAARRLD